MTQTDDLERRLPELAERCEAAEGADRALDHLIAVATEINDIFASPAMRRFTYDDWVKQLASGGNSWIPAYTASLDAAMTLVLEGYVVGSLKQRTRYEIVEAKNNSVDLSEQAAWSAWVHKDTNDRTFRVGLRFSHHGAAATPALALCAAALRARQALQEGSRHE